MRTMFLIIMIVAVTAGCHDELTQSVPNGTVREVYSIAIRKAEVSDRKLTLSVECVVPDPCYGFSHMETMIVREKIYLTIYTSSLTMQPCVQILGTFTKDIVIAVPSTGDYTLHYRYRYDEMRDTMFTVR
ncbi:MAG: hypothetical protein KA247_01350 [Bacteroidetes bacterium]|nr:hypothetical protein [Bacteroidota bacterium]